jgi:hypothetical protein
VCKEIEELFERIKKNLSFRPVLIFKGGDLQMLAAIVEEQQNIIEYI